MWVLIILKCLLRNEAATEKRKDLGFFLQLKLSLSKLLKAIFP